MQAPRPPPTHDSLPPIISAVTVDKKDADCPLAIQRQFAVMKQSTLDGGIITSRYRHNDLPFQLRLLFLAKVFPQSISDPRCLPFNHFSPVESPCLQVEQQAEAKITPSEE
jgi:hypothetical protein